MAEGKKFNLTELLNQRSMSVAQEGDTEKEENPEVMMIDVYDLEPSKDNFYQVDDSLKQSVEAVGILQPLLVKPPENGKYQVIAGHRRRLAVLSLVEEGKERLRFVPCIYKKESVQDRLALIMANRFRDKTDWEKMMEVMEAEGLARQLKQEHGLEGRSRDIAAQLMGMSQAQVGRYKAIYVNLDEGLMEKFKEGVLGFSAVSELCGLSREWQREAKRLLEEKGELSLPDIRELKERKDREERGREQEKETPVWTYPVQSSLPEFENSHIPIQPAPGEMGTETGEKQTHRELEKREKEIPDRRPQQIEEGQGTGEEPDRIPQKARTAGPGQFCGGERAEALEEKVYMEGCAPIRGYVVRSDQVCRRRVGLCPTELRYEEGGEAPDRKYGCPVCESLGNKHFFSYGTRNCPLCGVNLDWEKEHDGMIGN